MVGSVENSCGILQFLFICIFVCLFGIVVEVAIAKNTFLNILVRGYHIDLKLNLTCSSHNN